MKPAVFFQGFYFPDVVCLTMEKQVLSEGKPSFLFHVSLLGVVLHVIIRALFFGMGCPRGDPPKHAKSLEFVEPRHSGRVCHKNVACLIGNS